MRPLLAPALVASLSGCGSGAPPQIDRIEMRRSGWTATDVDVNSRGEGHYRLSDYPRQRSGTFRIDAARFQALVRRLEPFRGEAFHMTPEKARAILSARCPKGVPNPTDAGGFWIHWAGPHVDEDYVADFGCDHVRLAARNAALLSALASLPVPSSP